MPIAVVIHGGAGRIHKEDRPVYQAGLEAARDAGFARLEQGSSALEAVLSAVSLMEDNPEAFNAGTGGSPNRDGVVECDAAIMTGEGGSGAVAAITRAKNPILIAHKVMTETPHALFVGPGADALVDKPIDNEALLTPRMTQKLARWRANKRAPANSATVGAAARDARGRLAAATSTGGVLGKWPGRVGDSPIIGAGTYATRQVAISCTGQGEAFMRAVSAKEVALRLAYGDDLGTVIEESLAEVKRFDGRGGLIGVTQTERMFIGFNTETMAYAYKTAQGAHAEVSLQAGIVIL